MLKTATLMLMSAWGFRYNRNAIYKTHSYAVNVFLDLNLGLGSALKSVSNPSFRDPSKAVPVDQDWDDRSSGGSANPVTDRPGSLRIHCLSLDLLLSFAFRKIKLLK